MRETLITDVYLVGNMAERRQHVRRFFSPLSRHSLLLRLSDKLCIVLALLD